MKLIANSIRFLLAGAALSAGAAYAEAPAGYYASCENRSGNALLSSLFETINPHTNVGYSGLWEVYLTADVRPNGTIWDMYSTKEWTPAKDQCGNYSVIGDCYNREHSMPKSWFADAQPMYSDAFHIYPTDGKVNAQRSNYAYGECAKGTQVAANGNVKPLGRLGACTYPGYSGTVFEPDDQYKGDFARTYFYMAACYYDRIGTWKGGDADAMLSGDKDNPFKPWAIEMLLKWHRQDPVSEKETRRNDAVYAAQNNRNPFIDHPELAEYLWGNNKGQKWTSGAPLVTEINQPLNGTVIELGITKPGLPIERSIAVRTTNATENVAVTVIGGGFSVNTRSIAAATANQGTEVTITYAPTAVGQHAATLRVVAGSVSANVSIRAQAVDGLPVGPVTNITPESFTAVWTYVGDADAQGNYTLTVSDDQGVLGGYPKAVDARSGSYEVDGLMPATTYTYTVASTTETSEPLEVTTADALPSIAFLFDGTLDFVATPGEPSEVAEIVVDTEYIDGEFTVSVSAPFQLSLDKSDWSTSLTLTPDDERLYMRLFAQEPGEFTTSITARYGDYMADDAVAHGTTNVSAAFLEDFEKSEKGNYNDGEFEGTACTWFMHNAGVWSGNTEPVVSGTHSVRFGKNSDSSIEMTSDIASGIGTISFEARKWNNDAAATVAVEVSTDGGATYSLIASVDITEEAFKTCNVFAGVSGAARLRLRQTAGGRLNIDDIALTPHTSGCQYLQADYHAWDAFSRNGQLVIEVSREAGTFAIYALDGTTVAEGALAPGEHTFTLTPGLYIIANGEDARRVVIR